MGTQLLLYTAKHGITTLFLFFLLAHALPFSIAQRSPNPDPYATMKFSPSLAIIIAVLISALFFMGFFSIYIRHCSDSESASTVRPSAAGGNRSRRIAARGLNKDVLETFPTFVYSEVRTLKIGKGALECAVCLNEFEDDETLRLIPKCDHVFHPECIDAWLESHTTCPVCRANLSPQLGESTHQPTELRSDIDLEDQNDAAAAVEATRETQPPVEPQVITVNLDNQMLNRNRTRGSRSGRPRKYPRSHSTGHSLVQPGVDTERFTLRLPVDVRKQIMNRGLNRSHSLVVLPREGSSRRGYRGGDGSSRGRNNRWLDRSFKSDRWVFSMAPPFFQKASSFKTPKVAGDDANQSLVQPASSSSRPPV